MLGKHTYQITYNMPNPFTVLDYDSDDEIAVKTVAVKTSVLPNPKTAVVHKSTTVASPTKRWADYDTDDEE